MADQPTPQKVDLSKPTQLTVRRLEEPPAPTEQKKPELPTLGVQGASLLVLSDSEANRLKAEIPEELVEIREDGILYVPQALVRERLTEVVGAGQWSLIQHGITKLDNQIFYDGSLFVRGHYVARAVGEATYHPNNPMQSYATALESARSDCLMRCTKDLGIAKEMWFPAYVRKWREKNAVKVYRSDKKRYAWRRKDSPQFDDENIYQGLYDSLLKVQSIEGLTEWKNETEPQLKLINERQKANLGRQYNQMEAKFKEEAKNVTEEHTKQPESK